MEAYSEAFTELAQAGVRFLIIGVGAANYYAGPRQDLFATQDRDLFVPPEPSNLLLAWQVLQGAGWELWSGNEPLDEPMDLWLAEKVVAHSAAVQATRPEHLKIDLTLVMKGFGFEEAWAERRMFALHGCDVPVARLKHIVESKRLADRPKDHLFFATHEEILRDILAREETRSSEPRGAGPRGSGDL